QDPRDTGRQEVGERAGQERFEAESGQVGPPLGCQRPDAAELDADGTEVRKSAEGERRDREGARVELTLQLTQVAEGDQLVEHRARAEQAPDRSAVARRYSEQPGHRRQRAAEEILKRSAGVA